MPGEVRVEIGGIGLLFRYKNYRIKEDGNAELYIRDFIRPGRNHFIVDVRVGKLPKYPQENILFQAKENWRLYRNNRRYVFQTYQSPDEITRICIMGKDLSGAKAYILPQADNAAGDDEPYSGNRSWSLEQLMKILGHLVIISILHRYEAMLIHSSGIIFNKEGIIFTGISGAGKTTIAKLWQKRDGVTVLSDDRVIVRKVKGRYFVYGTPWPGEGKAASPESAPLKRILFLSKARQNTLVPLERKEALHRLITQCFPAIWDKEGIDFYFKFCGALVEDIPCFSLGFVPDESAVEFVENNC